MKTVEYGLLLPSGKLACVQDTYGIALSDYGEKWLVDSLEIVGNALFEDTAIYNSDWDCPNWGGYSRSDLTPVEVVTEITPVSVTIPMNIKDVFLIRDISLHLARRYSGRELSDSSGYIFCIVNYSVEEMQKHVDSVVYFGSRYSKRLVVAAIPIPDEYVDSVVEERGWDSSKPGCCLIAQW